MSRRIVCTLACVVPLTVAGIEMLAVRVTRESSRHHLAVEARLAAAPAAVLARLRHFERYEEINPALREATVLEVGSRTRVRLVTEACFWFFCRRMTHVQDFVVEPDDLRAHVVPDLSDFRSGAMVWEVVGDGLRSRLRMHGYMEPDFAVPPLIGPYLVRRTLSTLAGTALSGLERAAMHHSVLEEPD